MNLSCIFAVSLTLCASTAVSDIIELPSGTQAALHEVLVDKVNDENWVRFRLVAPAIDRSLALAPDYSALEGDFPYFCTAIALPYLQDFDLEADKISISLSDRILAFGASDPDATQYFELFRPENADCIWEGF